jgi:hypothetical protein
MKILFNKYWDQDCWQFRFIPSFSIFKSTDTMAIIFEFWLFEIQFWFGKKIF